MPKADRQHGLSVRVKRTLSETSGGIERVLRRDKSRITVTCRGITQAEHADQK